MATNSDPNHFEGTSTPPHLRCTPAPPACQQVVGVPAAYTHTSIATPTPHSLVMMPQPAVPKIIIIPCYGEPGNCWKAAYRLWSGSRVKSSRLAQASTNTHYTVTMRLSRDKDSSLPHPAWSCVSLSSSHFLYPPPPCYLETHCCFLSFFPPPYFLLFTLSLFSSAGLYPKSLTTSKLHYFPAVLWDRGKTILLKTHTYTHTQDGQDKAVRIPPGNPIQSVIVARTRISLHDLALFSEVSDLQLNAWLTNVMLKPHLWLGLWVLLIITMFSPPPFSTALLSS